MALQLDAAQKGGSQSENATLLKHGLGPSLGGLAHLISWMFIITSKMRKCLHSCRIKQTIAKTSSHVSRQMGQLSGPEMLPPIPPVLGG